MQPVNRLLVWFANIIPGLGFLLINENKWFFFYLVMGGIAWFFTFTIFIGLFFLIPIQFMACIHSFVLAGRYNARVGVEHLRSEQRLQDLEADVRD